jgi:hypothetical protein
VQAPDYTRKSKICDVEMLQKQDNIINYVLKYTAKRTMKIKKALVKDDPWFFEYDKK